MIDVAQWYLDFIAILKPVRAPEITIGRSDLL
jgi:hypothetical protein